MDNKERFLDNSKNKIAARTRDDLQVLKQRYGFFCRWLEDNICCSCTITIINPCRAVFREKEPGANFRHISRGGGGGGGSGVGSYTQGKF